MATNEFEDRLATLEREVAEMRTLLNNAGRVKDPRRTFGMFKDDPVYAEIVRLGREWREQENRKSPECL